MNYCKFLVRRAESHLYDTVALLGRAGFLNHVRIDSAYRPAVAFPVRPVKFAGGKREKSVVEINYVARAPEVAPELGFLHAVHAEGFVNAVIEKSPVRAAPPVYALFHVADHKVFLVFRRAFGNERSEILPLHHRGILKFVKQEIFIPDSRLLVNERSIRTVDNILENHVGIIDAEHVPFFQDGIELPVNVCGYAQFIQLPLEYPCGGVFPVTIAETTAEFFKRAFKRRIHHVVQFHVLLGKPFLMVRRLCQEGRLQRPPEGCLH